MLFSETNAKNRPAATTSDASKITLGGGYRMPARIPDGGKITLGGGYRLVTRTA